MPTLKEEKELYRGAVKITFYPNSHQYKMDGENLISVSRALGVIDKPALAQWRVDKGCDLLLAKLATEGEVTEEDIELARREHARFSEEAANLGTLVHEWCEKFIRSKLFGEAQPELPEDEKVLNGVLAFLKWNKENDVEYLWSERLVYSKEHGYVGTADLGIQIKGEYYLGDFKTSKSIFPEAYLQTAAYLHALQEEEGFGQYKGRYIIRLGKEDGEFEAVLVPSDYAEDVQTFLSALNIAKWKKNLERSSKSAL